MRRKGIRKKRAAFLALLIMVSMLVLLQEPMVYAAPNNEESAEGNVGQADTKEDSGTDTDGSRHDAVPSGAYNEFGLPVDTIDEYTSDNHPLENYEPSPESWLYMSYINKTSKNKGQYAILDTMKMLAEQNATLTDKNQKVSGNLDANPIVPYTDNAGVSGSGGKIVGKNAISLADGMNDSTIVEMNLYYRETGTFSKTHESGFFFRSMKRQKDGTYLAATSQYYDTKGGTIFKKLDSRNAAALTAMAAVDLDGDGVDELAAYTLYDTGAFITLFKQKDENGRMSLEKIGEIPLKDLNHDSDPWQFDQVSADGSFPVINLTASSLPEGKEHLIINVCRPLGVLQRSRNPKLAIYSMDNGSLKKEYATSLEYGDEENEEIFLYTSAVEADVNGDGEKEIVLAGYNASVDRYLLNMLAYDKDKGTYHKVNNTAFEIKPANTSDFTARKHFSMSEAVTLQAVKFKETDDSDYIFLAGHVLKFKESTDKTKTLGDGMFDVVMSMDLTGNKWGDYHFVSSAAAGRFAKDKVSSEQIAVVWQSYSKKDNVTMNISWLWSDGTGIKQHNTNQKYLYERGALSNGSSIILCPVADVNSAAYYKYEGKDFGWSAPQALAAVPAMPYWGELGPGGMPQVSFTVSRARTTGSRVDLSLQGGLAIGFDAVLGAGLAGNGVAGGGGFDIDELIGLAWEYSNARTKGKERKITVDADKDSVVVLSVPIVTYHYKRYIPETVITQQALDTIIKDTGTAPYYDNDPDKPIKAGDVVPAGWYSADTVIHFDEVYNSMYVDEYNRLCDKYSTEAIPIEKIDMKELYSPDYKKGDPSTYPSKKEDIKTIGQKCSVIGPVTIQNNKGTAEMTFTEDTALTSDFAFHLTTNLDVYGEAKAKFCLFANTEVGGKFGVAGSFDLQAGNVSVITNGSGISAQLVGPPTGKDFYSYNASLVAWNADWGTKKNRLLMVAPLVNARTDIPLPSENPYVYEAGADMALIGWNTPPADGSRQAETYKVYQDSGGGGKTFIGEAEKGENLFLVSGLSPGTEYTFYFTGVSQAPDSLESEYSQPLKVMTKSADSQIKIPADKPEDVYAKEGEQAEFSVGTLTPPAGHKLRYQWYRYTADSGTHMGTWEKMDKETSETLTIDSVTNEIDNSKYRLEVQSFKDVSIGNPVSEETVYSRAAALHVGNDTRPTCEITGFTRDKGKDDEKKMTPVKGTYYVTSGQLKKPVSIEALVKDKDGNPVTSGSVTFMYRKDGGTAQALGSVNSVDGSGIAALEWTPSEEGDYEIAAVYDSGMSVLAMSEPSVVKAGNLKDSFFIIQYETGGGVNAQENPFGISRNAGSAALQDASRNDYTFKGWYTQPSGGGTKVDELHPERIAGELGGNGIVYTLYADWEPIQHSITYEHGVVTGTVNNPNPASYTVQMPLDLKNPVLPGYEFKGWYKEEAYNTQVHSLPLGNEPKDAAGSSTLYAKWEEQEYPITYIMHGFEHDDSKSPLPKTYKVSQLPLSLPDVYPKIRMVTHDYDKEGLKVGKGERSYKFERWSINPIPANTVGEVIAEAEYSRDYTIIYLNPMGGELRERMLYFSSSSAKQELTKWITKKGFVFDGWYEGYDSSTGEYTGAKQEYGAFWSKDANKMYYAKWSAAPNQVTVRYHLNYGEDTDYYLPEETYTVKGDTIDRPGDPERKGYTFTGWYQDKELKKPWDFDKNIVPKENGDKFTLYAGFKELYYTVTFDLNDPKGTESVPEQKVQEGKTVVKPEDPAIQNQIFLGWYEDEACTSPYDFTSEVQNDMMLYAGWRSREQVNPNPDDNKILGIEDGHKYKRGSVLDFTVVGAGMDNDFPIEGDERYVPKSWSVNPSGTWSQAPYAASFETKDMGAGPHNLTVIFAHERFDSGAWSGSGDTAEAKVSFELTEDGEDPVPPEPGGDGEEPVPPEPGGDGEEPTPPEPGGDGEEPTPPEPGGDGEEPMPPEPGGDGEEPTPPVPGGDGEEPAPPEPGGDGEEPAPPVPGGDGEEPATPPVYGEKGNADASQTPSAKGEYPSTGDKNDLWEWGLLAVLSIIVGSTLIIVKERVGKKRRK